MLERHQPVFVGGGRCSSCGGGAGHHVARGRITVAEQRRRWKHNHNERRRGNIGDERGVRRENNPQNRVQWRVKPDLSRRPELAYFIFGGVTSVFLGAPED